jgi:hypothetical protein
VDASYKSNQLPRAILETEPTRFGLSPLTMSDYSQHATLFHTERHTKMTVVLLLESGLCPAENHCGHAKNEDVESHRIAEIMRLCSIRDNKGMRWFALSVFVWELDVAALCYDLMWWSK